MILQENIPLAPLTTLQVGGPARYFVEATSEAEVEEAVDLARERNLRLFVLGGGSNLVVADSGWPGLVLKVGLRGIADASDGPARRFAVAAGEEWDGFVATSVREGCAGIETMSGIPGTTGGTPVQNVGAYGQEVAETIASVRVLDLKSMRRLELANQECRFHYRTSIFNATERGRYIVLSVSFRLRPGGQPTVKYADLLKHFAGRPEPTLAEVREAVRAIRHSKAMLIVPGDEDCRSAGSFFKNPIVTLAQADAVAAIARARGIEREAPRYPAAGDQVKLSAGWLVENSGFARGFAHGRAAISRKHALAIVNRGGASAQEIRVLEALILSGVEQAFGVRLEPEPVLVGFGL